MLLWLFSTALATPDIRLAPEAPKVREQYRQFQRGQGKTGELACHDFAEGLVFCFRQRSGDTLRYLEQADLEGLGLSLEQVSAVSKEAASEHVKPDRYTREEIETLGFYWRSSVMDGWDAAGFLYPDKLKAMVGGIPLVAIPQQGVFLFWAQGNHALNKAVASGVKEIYLSSSHPVSPFVYRYSKGKWEVWGEAIPKN